ncbi:MAG: hypothetical protein WCH52_08095 [Bacteroidota bacterium]
MNKNYNVELDYILEQLIVEYENIYKGVKFYAEDKLISTSDKISQRLIDRFGLKEWEINVLCSTLFIDKYVKSIDPLTISLEGLVFFNNGGYVEKAELKIKDAIRLEMMQKEMKKYTFGLMIFTAIVAFGTLISAWFFAIEIIKHYEGLK